MYNLNVGEHYYSHVLNGEQGAFRGGLTFEERLAQSRPHGRRYEIPDRYQYKPSSNSHHSILGKLWVRWALWVPSRLRTQKSTVIYVPHHFASL